MSAQRKVLYSPGYGAGWTTWAGHDGAKKLMLEWPPLIAAVEREEEIDETHEAVRSLVTEIATQFGVAAVPYLGGARDLAVYLADGPVHIDEYDGSESVREPGDGEWL